MIVTRTPYRLSFFGGGTDFQGWFSKHGGAFISTTINKYCYIHCKDLPPFFPYSKRLVWSKIEQVNEFDEVKHPVIREAIRQIDADNIEIHHIGELPARSGLGSSSSFSVGIIHALSVLKNQVKSKYELANEAIKLERVILGETGGIQDQIAASFGGFNFVEIEKNGNYRVTPFNLTESQKDEFEASLLLVFTGIFRNSFEVLKQQPHVEEGESKELESITRIVHTAKGTLKDSFDLKLFGELLDETWQVKKRMGNNITNPKIDEIYSEVKSLGAYGGKLLGAGAGGFLVFLAPEKDINKIRDRLSRLVTVPVKLDFDGTTYLKGSFG